MWEYRLTSSSGCCHAWCVRASMVSRSRSGHGRRTTKKLVVLVVKSRETDATRSRLIGSAKHKRRRVDLSSIDVGQSAGGELGEACSKLVIVGQHNKIGHENMITIRGISSQSLQGSWAFPADIRGRQRASGCMCNHPCLLPLLIYHHHKPEIRPRPRISLAYFP